MNRYLPVLNAKLPEELNLETWKETFKKFFEEKKIPIKQEISEDLLREVFLEVKEKIAEKSEYKVDKIEFPNIFAVLLWKRDFKKFKATIWDNMTEEAKKKTLEFFEEEHGEKCTRKKFVNGAPAFATPLEEDESFYFIAVINERSLKHEITHFFELVLKLKWGSLQ